LRTLFISKLRNLAKNVLIFKKRLKLLRDPTKISLSKGALPIEDQDEVFKACVKKRSRGGMALKAKTFPLGKQGYKLGFSRA